MVRKKTGDWRFCIDFRRLNAETVQDSYPLPRIEDLLTELQGAKWFSAVDASAGYWQIELEESAKQKTAFSIGQGLWESKLWRSAFVTPPQPFNVRWKDTCKIIYGNLCWYT